jgi:glucose/arabinose dehydrogenase
MGFVAAGPATARTPEAEKDDPRVDLSAEFSAGFEAVPIAGPFEFPWSLAFLPDGEVLLTERAGRLQLIPPGRGAREVTGLPPILTAGQAGLFDVALDHHFARNGIVYLSYVHGTEEKSKMRVLRARLDRARVALVDKVVIFESTPARDLEMFGGRMVVTADHHLFLALGDRWEHRRAQDLSNHAGKIVRIRTDGSVPDDNPFVGRPGARPEIWSYGHRNPLGLAFDERKNLLWSHENGPQGGDELNLIIPGRNYGWPVISHGRHYSGEPIPGGTASEGMEQPQHAWTPAIAPSGLAIVEGQAGSVFWLGALAAKALVWLRIEQNRVGSEQRFLEKEIGRIRDVRIGTDGLLYVVTDDAEGRLYRLDPVVEQAERGGRRQRF